MLVVGDKEMEDGKVAVRLRGGENLGTKSVVEIIQLAAVAVECWVLKTNPPCVTIRAKGQARITKHVVACDVLSCKILQFFDNTWQFRD